MSCNAEHFLKQEEFIREYWFGKDIINGIDKDVDIYFYSASKDDKIHFNKRTHRIELPCDDSIHGTYEKTIKCFIALDKLGIEYDYIFRTNCSTMINVYNLKLFIEQIKDDNKIYCGNLYANRISSGPSPYDLYGLGKGLILSKKWIERIVSKDVEEYVYLLETEEQKKDVSLLKVDDNAIGFIINSWCRERGIDSNDIWFDYGMSPGFNSNFYKDESRDWICSMVAIPFRTYGSDRTVEFARGNFLWSIIRDRFVISDDYLNKLTEKQRVCVWYGNNMHIVERDVYNKNKENIEKILAKQ